MTLKNKDVHKLLTVTLAIVLVAGLVTPASAENDANIDDSVQPAPLPAVSGPQVGEITIAFAPLAGPNGTPYTGHIENGFVVTSISGTWQEAFNVGNPIPSIFHLTSNGAQAGVNIEQQGGGNFDLLSIDVGTGGGSSTTMDVSCTARNQGNVVGNALIQYSGNVFQTFGFDSTFSNIDSVDCTASNFVTSSVNLDNFVVREPFVGGEFIPIDSTALLLAGAQTNAVWILSALAVIGSVAFGALYLTTKRN